MLSKTFSLFPRSAGSSKINGPNFSDTCSVRANWLCMGWPFCLAEMKREFQTAGNFFAPRCTTGGQWPCRTCSKPVTKLSMHWTEPTNLEARNTSSESHFISHTVLYLSHPQSWIWKSRDARREGGFNEQTRPANWIRTYGCNALLSSHRALRYWEGRPSLGALDVFLLYLTIHPQVS